MYVTCIPPRLRCGTSLWIKSGGLRHRLNSEQASGFSFSAIVISDQTIRVAIQGLRMSVDFVALTASLRLIVAAPPDVGLGLGPGWPGISFCYRGMPDIPSEITLLEDEIASLQFVAALTRVSRIREAAKVRLAARRRRLRKLNTVSLYSTLG
jgi:hypothetical protein